MNLGLLLGISGAGALGAVVRFVVSRAAAPRSRLIPWGTIFVNFVGAFAAGLLAGLAATRPEISSFPILTVGFLGGFTTFSGWMLEVMDLREARGAIPAALYAVGAIAAGLLLALGGLWVGAAA